MRAGENLNVSSRARQRAEIEAQIEQFLRRGGQIDVLQNGLQSSRPIGSVWWDYRSSGPVASLR